MTTRLAPDPPRQFVPGPRLRPASALRDWLDREAKATPGARRRVKLPVVIRFENEHRRRIVDAFVGTSEQARDGALMLSINDAPLSVSLSDTLRPRCPAGRAWCAVWLEGYWGPLLEDDPPEMGIPLNTTGDRSIFAVLRVHDVISDAPAPEACRALLEQTEPA